MNAGFYVVAMNYVDLTMKHNYFSDRELGSKPQTLEDIPQNVWNGIVSLTDSLIAKGAFGLNFPAECADGLGTVGTDYRMLTNASGAEIPNIEWPLREDNIPSTLAILDLIEFCYLNVAYPIPDNYHKFFQHYHLKFDAEKGRNDYRDNINRIFKRNGIAYELKMDCKMQRLVAPVIKESINKHHHTGDGVLDEYLETAINKFLDPDAKVRHEALEKLWDAWERIKTLEPGKDKKVSMSKLLDKASAEPEFRSKLEAEAIELTAIGNRFQIRHSETAQIPLTLNKHVDYLFHRLYALINLLLLSR